MTIDDETPMERLQAQRLACDLGIAAATACIADERLAQYEAGYRTRLAGWTITRDAVDRAIAELPRNTIYAGSSRDELQALARAYAAHQVTPHEYGLWSKRLRGVR